MLRDMAMAARHGKTVVLTIHQPVFRVTLLVHGVVRHHALPGFIEARLDACGHACRCTVYPYPRASSGRDHSREDEKDWKFVCEWEDTSRPHMLSTFLVKRQITCQHVYKGASERAHSC
ncbi:hypothetical protein ACP70R_032585 [Stipagrostis hirtigluma subsp. patula]